MRRCAVATCLLVLAGLGLAQGLRLEVLTPVSEVLPRQTVTLIANVGNEDLDTWQGTAQVRLPPGWRMLVPPDELVLKAGETKKLLFTLVTPAEAAAGTYRLPISISDPIRLTGEEAVFVVRVLRVDKLDLTLLEAPRHVVAETYYVRFAVLNEGNATVELDLSVNDNLRYPVTVEPQVLTLAPASSAEVVVTAEVPASLGRSATHAIWLIAQVSDDPTTLVRHFTEVELIPSRPSARAAWHTFPLRMRISAGVDASATNPNLADTLVVPELHVSGSGPLWDRDPGRFSVSFKNTLDMSGHENLVSYQGRHFRIAAGDQGFDLSPLSPNRKGFGFDAQANARLTPALELGARAFAYNNDETTALGARTSLTLFSQVELAANALIPLDASAPIVSGQLRVRPDLSGDAELNLDLEYGRRWAAGDSAAAFAVQGDGGTDDLGLNLGWRQSGAGYTQEEHDRYVFSAGGNARLIRPTQQVPLQAGVSVWHRREAAYPAAGLLVGEPVFHSYQLGGGVNGAWEATRWSLRYDMTDQVDRSTGESKQGNSLLFSVALPFRDRLQVRQALSWRRALTHESSQADHFLAYGAGVDVPMRGGWLKPYTSVEWSVSGGRLEKLTGGVSWLGGPDSVFDASVDATFEPQASQWLQLTAEGDYQFEELRSLELGATLRLNDHSGPSLQVRTAYNLPLDVPIGRLSNVGRLSGKVVDEAGMGVTGLIMRVAGQSAITQADGRFTFPGLPEGEQFLTLLPAGLGAGKRTLPAMPHRVMVRADEPQHLTFTVIETARVRGQVRIVLPVAQDASPDSAGVRPLAAGEPGNPARGLLVELRDGSTTQRTLTDEEGYFLFDQLLPGEWRLTLAEENLQGRFRLTPPQQTLDLRAGEVASPTIEIFPIERSVDVVEGGTLQSGPRDLAAPNVAAPATLEDATAVRPATEGVASPEPQEQMRQRSPSEDFVELGTSDAELGFWAPYAKVPPGKTIVLYLRSARDIVQLQVSSPQFSLVAVNEYPVEKDVWRILLIPVGLAGDSIEIPFHIIFADGSTVDKTVALEVDPLAPIPTDFPYPGLFPVEATEQEAP